VAADNPGCPIPKKRRPSHDSCLVAGILPSDAGVCLTEKINPSHYKSYQSGIECIQVTEHMNFNLGNAIKYVWRAGLKGDAVEDLEKAAWYLDREIKRRRGDAE